jgi:putative glutamine amidotransferase
MSQTIKIGITDCGKFENYRRWIESVEGTEVIKLSSHLQNAEDVAGCDGILFSGGEDIHPGLYGKPEFVEEFDLNDIIPERDQLEFQVIRLALEQKKPVLGICRGLQLINVYLGGTLVPDIPTILHSEFHSKKQGIDQVHPIQVIAGSQLMEISGKSEGLVNSAHHQSADKPAPPLKITAFSDSNIVEALEWLDPTGKSWLQLVQWHPERMTDLSSPFSLLLRKAFLQAASKTLHREPELG